MTLDTTLRKKIYLGNGATTVFETGFVFNTQAEVKVTHVDASGAEKVLTLGTDYSVTGGTGAEGSVTFPAQGSTYPTLPDGEKLVVYRELHLIQELDLTNFNDFDVELIEQAFDRVYMILQGHAEALTRCVQIQISSTEDPSLIVSQVYQAASGAAASAAAAATNEAEAKDARDAAFAAQQAAELAAAKVPTPNVAENSFLMASSGSNVYALKTASEILSALALSSVLKSDAPGQALSTAIAEPYASITDAETPTIDLTTRNRFKWTLGADRTFPPLNPAVEGEWHFNIYPEGKTFTLDTSWNDKTVGSIQAGAAMHRLCLINDGESLTLYIDNKGA